MKKVELQIMRSPPNEDFSLKETKPHNSGAEVTGNKLTSTHDLLEQMQYLYVRVVKARELHSMDITGSCHLYAEVRLGNYKSTTCHFENVMNPEWNQVFAFSKDRIQASVLEVTVIDKDVMKDNFIGRVLFDVNEIPKRVPPDSPLAPRWYRLEERKGEKVKGELMLAVWWGTRAGEAFPEAWHSDPATVGCSAGGVAKIRSKMYLSPKLWYLRVNVIEARDMHILYDRTCLPEFYVKAFLGSQALRTTFAVNESLIPSWNEDLMFVAAEPFEETLYLSLNARFAPNKEVCLGKCAIPILFFDRRLDHKAINSRWYHLEKPIVVEDEIKEVEFVGRIHLRVCLEGGYHVFDESIRYSSDLRPTAKQLWNTSIGVLEVGILSAHGLAPMKLKDGRASTDAYCVAKYGTKWIRTRTILDSFAPKWNESCTWEVFDPSTVITIGVFDNCCLHGEDKAGWTEDSRIGKVRIFLSILETDRVYIHSYPLLVLHPNGVKKMGEIHLAVRYTCSSLLNMMHMYSQPLLPKMHYIYPLNATQLDWLRFQATQIVAISLSRAEPPLRKEVVEYMLDVGSHTWSMRRSKANTFRIFSVLGGLDAIRRWFDQICNWKSPVTTVLIHILFLILLLCPELIILAIFFSLLLIGIWSYKWRPTNLAHMDACFSYVDKTHPDELDEEFDTFPTSRPAEVVRMRYDRLRTIAGRVQSFVGDLATQGERLQSLLSWSDPRATALFFIFYLVAAIVLYVVPIRYVALTSVFYMLRHPKFRHKLPGLPLNFFRRLPARTML